MIDLQEKGFDYIKEAVNSNNKLVGAEFSEAGKASLIVPDWEWIKHFNQQLIEKHPEIIEQLQKETYGSEDSWIDHLTSGDWGFEEEYRLCSCCGSVIRITPDSAFWKQDFYIDYEFCAVTCGDCVRADPKRKQEYIEYLSDNSDRANTILTETDLETVGFSKHFEEDKCIEIGMVSDNPTKVLKKLQKENPGMEYIFCITSSTPFFDVINKFNT